MWISGGDHELSENIVHLVLARIPGAPAGTRGISLFLVPKFLVAPDGALGERNDVALAGINHKMGYRGTANTAPVFGDGAYTPGGQPGAVGYLVGAENRGLPVMFTMMNEARIGVGLGATALGYTGYLKSLAYARDRLQGRPNGADPSTPQVPLVEHADIRRMLLAQKSYAEGALALILYCARLVDDVASLDDPAGVAEAEKLLGVLTPIAKSWPSQWCLAANDLAIQVLGGAGYTRDFDVELHYRDNRLNPIHEGTHGIQGMDLLGRKVLLDGGAGLGVLLGRMQATAARAEAVGGEAGEHAAQLRAVADRLVAVTGFLGGLGDPRLILADATAYLEATGHLVVAWLWLEQCLAADGKEGTFYEGKRAAARYFFARELPKVGPMLDLLGERRPDDGGPGPGLALTARGRASADDRVELALPLSRRASLEVADEPLRSLGGDRQRHGAATGQEDHRNRAIHEVVVAGHHHDPGGRKWMDQCQPPPRRLGDDDDQQRDGRRPGDVDRGHGGVLVGPRDRGVHRQARCAPRCRRRPARDQPGGRDRLVLDEQARRGGEEHGGPGERPVSPVPEEDPGQRDDEHGDVRTGVVRVGRAHQPLVAQHRSLHRRTAGPSQDLLQPGDPQPGLNCPVESTERQRRCELPRGVGHHQQRDLTGAAGDRSPAWLQAGGERHHDHRRRDHQRPSPGQPAEAVAHQPVHRLITPARPARSPPKSPRRASGGQRQHSGRATPAHDPPCEAGAATTRYRCSRWTPQPLAFLTSAVSSSRWQRSSR